MAELKGQILWLNSVSTTRGKSECGFGKLFTFEAQMDAQQVATELQRLQDRLDDIQDQLDRHNVMTQVDLWQSATGDSWLSKMGRPKGQAVRKLADTTNP